MHGGRGGGFLGCCAVTCWWEFLRTVLLPVVARLPEDREGAGLDSEENMLGTFIFIYVGWLTALGFFVSVAT